MEPLGEPGSLRSTAHVPEPSLPASDLWVPGWGVFMGRRAALDSQGLTKREAKGQAGLCCLNKSSRQVPSLLLPSLPSAAHDLAGLDLQALRADTPSSQSFCCFSCCSGIQIPHSSSAF